MSGNWLSDHKKSLIAVMLVFFCVSVFLVYRAVHYSSIKWTRVDLTKKNFDCVRQLSGGSGSTRIRYRPVVECFYEAEGVAMESDFRRFHFASFDSCDAAVQWVEYHYSDLGSVYIDSGNPKDVYLERVDSSRFWLYSAGSFGAGLGFLGLLRIA